MVVRVRECTFICVFGGNKKCLVVFVRYLLRDDRVFMEYSL